MRKKLFAGTMATVFLATMVFIAIPVQQVSAFTDPPIEIGVIGPVGWIQMDGLLDGAQLAADLINDAGGMCGHEVVLVPIDEHSVPNPDPASAKIEVKEALDAHPNMKFLIGGFEFLCVYAIREEVADYFAANNRPIWFICGASTDEIIEAVKDDYARYKFLFRVNPCNLTTLLTAWTAGALRQLIIPKLLAMYGGPQVKYYVITDDIWTSILVWPPVAPFDLGPNATWFGVIAASKTESNFVPIIGDVPSDCHLVIHLFSAVAGKNYIATYGTLQPNFTTVGVNVESQRQELYGEIDGLCEYECFLASVGTRTDLNPNAKPLGTAAFWDEYVARYGHSPIYTSWGAYDAIIALNETCSQWLGNWTAGTMNQTIPLFEATDRVGILGKFKYTEYHDVFCNELGPTWTQGYVRPLLVQWQAGRMEVVWPQDKPYSRKYMIPPWMYELAETDFIIDGLVDITEISAVTGLWFKTPPWYLLEADMAPQDHFINVYDVANVAIDWGKNAAEIYGQWPLP